MRTHVHICDTNTHYIFTIKQYSYDYSCLLGGYIISICIPFRDWGEHFWFSSMSCSGWWPFCFGEQGRKTTLLVVFVFGNSQFVILSSKSCLLVTMILYQIPSNDHGPSTTHWYQRHAYMSVTWGYLTSCMCV